RGFQRGLGGTLDIQTVFQDTACQHNAALMVAPCDIHILEYNTDSAPVVGGIHCTGGDDLVSELILCAQRGGNLIGFQHKAHFAFEEVRPKHAVNTSNVRHSFHSFVVVLGA